MKTITSVEAQNHFGELLDTVQREPVTITRHGRVAAFVVSPQDMDELKNVRSKRSKAVEEFEAFFAKSDPTLSPQARSLTDEDIAKLVHESR